MNRNILCVECKDDPLKMEDLWVIGAQCPLSVNYQIQPNYRPTGRPIPTRPTGRHISR